MRTGGGRGRTLAACIVVVAVSAVLAYAVPLCPSNGDLVNGTYTHAKTGQSITLTNMGAYVKVENPDKPGAFKAALWTKASPLTFSWVNKGSGRVVECAFREAERTLVLRFFEGATRVKMMLFEYVEQGEQPPDGGEPPPGGGEEKPPDGGGGEEPPPDGGADIPPGDGGDDTGGGGE